MTAAEAIYRVLVEECGAYDDEDERRAFAFHWPDCREYRFQGKLGFGGKVWFNPSYGTKIIAASPGVPERQRVLRPQSTRQPVYVNCYPEDETPERLVMIERANERLRAFEIAGGDVGAGTP